MTKWCPTPEDELVTARRMVGDSWEACRIENLRKGDVFMCVSPDGDFVHAHTLEADEESVAMACDDAVKMDPLGSMGTWYGWGVACEVYASFDELKARGLS